MNGGYYERNKSMLLARAYVPFQRLHQVYTPSEALEKGTLFPELYMSYDEEKMLKEGRYYG
jgi:hypothetical protein